MAQQQFASKTGLVAATVGSAVGLGTVWRFPAETQAGGGAAFLLIYVLCILVLGIPVMLAEFALGRGGGSDAIGSYKALSPHGKWHYGGLLAVIAATLIMMFYMVVGGWTLEYLLNSITGDLYGSLRLHDNANEAFTEVMHNYVYTDFMPVVNAVLMVGINIAILLGGVQKGIERLSTITMPILFLLLAVFCCYTLTLDGAGQGVKFFLSPDFSKITPSVVVSAMGQAFFSLSLGMGILVTYASYFPKDTNLTRTSVTVCISTLLVAILMGLIIFPALTSFGLSDRDVSGTTLVFVTLPEMFTHMPGTQLWSIAFFALLLIAALTSTVSLAEVPIAYIQHRYNTKRSTAVLVTLLPIAACAAICAMSFGSLSWIHIMGQSIFSFLDSLTSYIMLPVVALITCIYIGWFAPKGLMRDQLSHGMARHSMMVPLVIFAIRILAPACIIIILVSNLLNT